MPLNDGAINEILPFAPEGLVEAGDLLSLDEYREHALRKRGHIPGIALRELQNRASRQAAHVTAGLAQFLANRYEPGVRDDADLDKIEAALLDVITKMIEAASTKYDISMTLDYFLGWHVFGGGIHPAAKPGMVPVNGTLLADAATRYPQGFAYLQSSEGQQLCTTEADWQAAHTAFWATLADGTQVGWNNIGGICRYVIDTDAGTIRVPDLRGMYAEVAGFDLLSVGGVHGDAGRNIAQDVFQQRAFPNANYNSSLMVDGTGINLPTNDIFRIRNSPWASVQTVAMGGTFATNVGTISIDLSNAVPTAAKNQPRAWGALACVYLGQPAS